MGLRCFFLSFVGAERLECVEFKNAASLRKRMNLKRRCSVVVETDDLPLCFCELLNLWLVYVTYMYDLVKLDHHFMLGWFPTFALEKKLQRGGFVREHWKIPEIWSAGLGRLLHRSGFMHCCLGMLVSDGGQRSEPCLGIVSRNSCGTHWPYQDWHTRKSLYQGNSLSPSQCSIPTQDLQCIVIRLPLAGSCGLGHRGYLLPCLYSECQLTRFLQ